MPTRLMPYRLECVFYLHTIVSAIAIALLILSFDMRGLLPAASHYPLLPFGQTWHDPAGIGTVATLDQLISSENGDKKLV